MKDEKQSKTNNDISELFNPQTYSLKNSLSKLENMGGLLGLINNLKTCHRNGLSSNNKQDHEARINKYGRNAAPDGQNIYKKSLLEQRDFIVNFLFYLLTLRICVKLLLFRDQLRGLNPLGDEKFVLRINAQLISYFLLISMVFLKARVTVEYYNMDKDQRKYRKQTKLCVRRDGQQQQINQQDLMVGDILIVTHKQTIRIDGIVVKINSKFIVSQAQTILREDNKQKIQIWQIFNGNDKQKDPFILAGSYVIDGRAQILVCTVGPKCSFRVQSQNKGYYSQYTPSIAQLKKIMNNIQNIAKTVAILLATYLSITYLWTKYMNQNLYLSWLDLLYILKVYCGYIGLICFVQRLKIIKSLQFYIQANRSQRYYRIKNRASLEQLSKLDILFIQLKALPIRTIQDRNGQKTVLDHITHVSQINQFCQVKIISKEIRQKFQQIFGKDIDAFARQEGDTYPQHVRSLVQATFLSQTPVYTFINDYLPIFQAMKYQIGYLYNARNKANVDIPQQILQISFQSSQVRNLCQQQQQQKQTNSTTVRTSQQNNFWIKIHNKLQMEDVLFNLFIKSHLYSQLQITNMTLYINNVLVIIILCYFSTSISVINLSWYLLIIIVNRFMFFQVYQRTNQFLRYLTAKNQNDYKELEQIHSTIKQALDISNYKHKKQINTLSPFKLNLVLFFYYFYVANRMKFISSIFVFFFVNSILRIQSILYQKRPFSRRQYLKIILKYFGIYVIVHIVIILIQWNEQGLFLQELNNIKYAIGLFLIFIVYALYF